MVLSRRRPGQRMIPSVTAEAAAGEAEPGAAASACPAALPTQAAPPQQAPTFTMDLFATSSFSTSPLASNCVLNHWNDTSCGRPAALAGEPTDGQGTSRLLRLRRCQSRTAPQAPAGPRKQLLHATGCTSPCQHTCTALPHSPGPCATHHLPNPGAARPCCSCTHLRVLPPSTQQCCRCQHHHQHRQQLLQAPLGQRLERVCAGAAVAAAAT